jgi:hypothetical protein
VQLQAFMACLPFLMKLLPLKQILSWMDIEKIVINKDNPATNMPGMQILIKKLSQVKRTIDDQNFGLMGAQF